MDEASLEWLEPQRWKSRAERLCAFLYAENGVVERGAHLSGAQIETLADVICLQEYLFEPAYEELFQRSFPESTFGWIKAKRPGRKRDGLVILFHRQRFQVQAWHCFTLNPLGDRIGLLAHLVPTRAPHIHLIVVNVHLTFPHQAWDTLTRKLQVRAVHQEVSKALKLISSRHRSVILCGDWNTLSFEDPVLEYLDAAGYRRCRLPEGAITHLTHDGRQVCCDHIFLDDAQGNILTNVELLPMHLRVDEWPATNVYDLSDHRPVRVDVTLEAERCSL
jgi:endonuclease/exonuclease/phosphatase family metal-dependent hydrolase